MELAIRDIGVPKILFAAFCSAVTKPFGKRGVFYKIVGDAGRAIDGPCDYTLPPYNHYAKLAPKDPDKVAAALRAHTGCKAVVVMDANDIGREILGVSSPDVDVELCKEIFRDNPACDVYQAVYFQSVESHIRNKRDSRGLAATDVRP